jgi:glycosyltransferase involved in cell wall biosynthesis
MDLSVVVPVYNEVENLTALHAELHAALAAIGGTHEILFVDDGSDDGSDRCLAGIQERDPHVVVIRLARNYGQTAALAAGLAHSRGRDVVTMDGDRQNDPADIAALLEKRREGYDLVAGWRAARRDPWLNRRLPSALANALIGLITGVRLHDYGCTLKAMDGDLARSLRLYGEMHRFIPALVHDEGGQIAEMKVHHRPRVAGRSKYGISRTLRVFLDLVTVKFLSIYSTRPIHVFGLLGLVSTFIGLAIVGLLGFEKLYLGARIGDRPLLLLGILLTIMGLQFVTMGLLGELLVRTYHESQSKPVYRVERVLGGQAELTSNGTAAMPRPVSAGRA